MGRNKINEENKKVRVSLTINPDIGKKIKERHINLSSLVNKLLIDYLKK